MHSSLSNSLAKKARTQSMIVQFAGFCPLL